RLQALCILAASATNFADSGSMAWYYIGLASSMIRLLRVDVDPTDIPNADFDWLTVETRRRCWWAIFLLDRWTSTLRGRPTCLPKAESTIGPICSEEVWAGEGYPSAPSPYDRHARHRFTTLIQLTDIGIDVVELVTNERAANNATEVDEAEEVLNSRLSAWLADLPPDERVSLDTEWIRCALQSDDPTRRLHICNQIVFHSYVSLLHKRRALAHLRAASVEQVIRELFPSPCEPPPPAAARKELKDTPEPLRRSLVAARAVADLLRALLAAAPPRDFSALPAIVPFVNQAFLPLLAAVRCGAAPPATEADASLAAFVAYYRRVGVTHPQSRLSCRAARALLRLVGPGSDTTVADVDVGGGSGGGRTVQNGDSSGSGCGDSGVEEPHASYLASSVMNAGLFSAHDGYSDILHTFAGL
ncbi:hypothetical protein HK405_012986, partial [Cladochytrium tenue]